VKLGGLKIACHRAISNFQASNNQTSRPPPVLLTHESLIEGVHGPQGEACLLGCAICQAGKGGSGLMGQVKGGH
jgi:hypothetical protein